MGSRVGQGAGLRTIAVTHTYPSSSLRADPVIATLDALTLNLVHRLELT